MRVNCWPAKRCVWPVSAPAQAFVRAGERRGNSEFGIGVRGMSASGLPFLARRLPSARVWCYVSVAAICPRFMPGLPFLSRLCPRRASGLPFLARRLLSARARPSVSVAALPSARARSSVSVAAIYPRFTPSYCVSDSLCPRFMPGLPFLARFALDARSAFRFSRGSALNSSCPCDSTAALLSARTQPSVSAAALPLAHPVRAVLA